VLSVAHIVNPVAAPGTSDLKIGQPVTIESMRVARRLAEEQVLVRQLVTCYPEDLAAAPGDFEKTAMLDRSVLDFGSFANPRKLPLLVDVLDRLYKASDGADYLIYTNMDIALMPSFYLTVAGLVEAGTDAFTINRRTITNRYQAPSDLPLLYAEIGRPHPGRDCFVFPRQAYPRYRLGRVCLGAWGVDYSLVLNLAAFAQRFREFTDLHATFHIGRERVWRHPQFAEFKAFNASEVEDVLLTLEHEAPASDRTDEFEFWCARIHKSLEKWRAQSGRVEPER
jgi:hypothetical protein